MFLKELEFDDILHVVRRRGRINNNQQLMLLGSVHDPNPNRWYYGVAQQLFDTWRTETEGQKRCIIVEGLQQHRPLFGATAEDSIKNCHSELGLQNFWGNKYGIKVIASEPPNYLDIFTLLQLALTSDEFSVTDVLLYIGIREMPIFYRMDNPRLGFTKWMRRILGKYRRSVQRECSRRGLPFCFSISYKTFKKLHRQHLGFSPSANGEWIDPKTGLTAHKLYLKITTAFARDSRQDTPLARVSHACIVIRDQYKSHQLWGLWQKGWSAWSWQGSIHSSSFLQMQVLLGDRAPLGKDRNAPPGRQLGTGWNTPRGMPHGAYILAESPALGYLLAEDRQAKRQERRP